MRKDLLQYYHALGLSPGASPEEIKRSYRMLIHQWHPDLFKPRSLMQTTADDITKELNEAYEQLIKKKRYRQYLSMAEPRRSASAPPPSAPAQRAREAYERAAGQHGNPPPAPPKPPSRSKQPGPRPAPPPPKRPPTGKPPSPPRTVASHRFRRWPLAVIAVSIGLIVAVLSVHRTVQAPSGEGSVPEDLAARIPARNNSTPVGSTRAPASERKTLGAASPVTDAGASAAMSVQRLACVTRAASLTTAGAFEAAVPFTSGQGAGILRSPVDGLRQFSPLQVGPVSGSLVHEESGLIATPSSAWRRFIGERMEGFDTFEVGDPKARVMAVQGAPDDAGETVFRYGSSAVYFDQGFVTGWSDRQPGLHVRAYLQIGFGLLETFTYGSSKSEVVRAQGEPTEVTSHSYYYGSSVVEFDREWVINWTEGDRPLKTRRWSNLRFADGDRPPPSGTDGQHVAPRN